MPARITLKDVAERAGVSIMTVSRALRNQRVLAADTRERIQKLALEMGYRPDPKVSELMARLRNRRPDERCETLAMIWPDYSPIHEDPVAEGIRRRADELGFKLEDVRLSSKRPDTRQIDRMLWNRGIRGIIIAMVRPPHETLDFRWDRYAAVAVDYTLEHSTIHRVATDHYQTMTVALAELDRLGYRRIGLAMERQMDERVNYLWRSGYLGYHSVHSNLTPLPIHVPERFNRAGLADWITETCPDCILSAGQANQVYDLLIESGYRLPNELGYASFDLYSHPESDRFRPKLSGMVQPRLTKGKAAVDLVVNVLHGNGTGFDDTPRTLIIPSAWQAGETTCPSSP